MMQKMNALIMMRKIQKDKNENKKKGKKKLPQFAVFKKTKVNDVVIRIR